jgi:hypothetical protein
MKKIVLAISGLVISLAGFSQFSVGLQGTGSLANAQIKNAEDFDYKKKMRAMPGAGVVVQYAFNENFALRSGVNYQQNGVKLTATAAQEAIEMKIELANTLHYVQVPVNALFTVPVGGFKFYAGAGGYVNYGISGKTKSTVTYTLSPDEKETIKDKTNAFKKDEDGGANLKRTDFGASALAGIQLPGGLFANVGYQLGLSNMSSGEEGKYKNRSLQLSIGYFF